MDVLVNIADMCVDSRGHMVGFDRRLEDVRTRYGAQSAQYREWKRWMPPEPAPPRTAPRMVMG